MIYCATCREILDDGVVVLIHAMAEHALEVPE